MVGGRNAELVHSPRLDLNIQSKKLLKVSLVGLTPAEQGQIVHRDEGSGEFKRQTDLKGKRQTNGQLVNRH